MQLSYRGVKYNSSQPAVEVTESPEVGQYRGVPYHMRRALNTAARRAKHADVLKYRGAVIR